MPEQVVTELSLAQVRAVLLRMKQNAEDEARRHPVGARGAHAAGVASGLADALNVLEALRR